MRFIKYILLAMAMTASLSVFFFIMLFFFDLVSYYALFSY